MLSHDEDAYVAGIREVASRLFQIPPDRIRADARFMQFGIDSLQVMDLVLELEAAYDVSIDDDSLNDVETVGDLARRIRTLRSS